MNGIPKQIMQELKELPQDEAIRKAFEFGANLNSKKRKKSIHNFNVIYKTTYDNEKVKIINKLQYLKHCFICEIGEKIQLTNEGDLYYTFKKPGKHEVHLQFKDENLTTLREAFSYCEHLYYFNKYLFDNCQNIIDCHGLFQYCSSLCKIPSNAFSGLINVCDFSFAFMSCKNLCKIPSNAFRKCSKITTFYCAFNSCYALTKIPNALFDKNIEVDTFGGAFSNCVNLLYVPKYLFAKNLKVTDFHCTFSYCPRMKNIPMDKNNAPLYDRNDNKGFKHETVKKHYDCFYYCISLYNYADIPTDWTGQK